MPTMLLTAITILGLAAAVAAQRPACEWCPVLDTPNVLTWDIPIAGPAEPGERIEISGRVLNADSTPAADVILYLYHTNSKGVYPHSDTDSRSSHAYWHGSQRGWLKTNSRGEYRIRTIKPASYPNSTIPAHIHCVVKEPDADTGYYVDDFLFYGDPYLKKSESGNAAAPSFVVKLMSSPDGVHRGRRDIVLAGRRVSP